MDHGFKTEYEFKTLRHDEITGADMPAFRQWQDAVRQGFHESRANDDMTKLSVDLVREDEAVLRGAYRAAASALRHPERPVATFVSFAKSMTMPDRTQLPAHLISDVTVSPTDRRRGLLRRLMTDDLTEAHERGLPIAALTVSEATIYGRFGFGPATFVNAIEVDTSQRFSLRQRSSGTVEMIEPEAIWPVAQQVFGRFHERTPGSITRPAFERPHTTGEWDFEKQAKDDQLRAAVHLDDSGEPDGYVTYLFAGWDKRPRTIAVRSLVGADTAAELALWEFLGSIDLVEQITFGRARPGGGALPWALVDQRGIKITSAEDGVWVRILDADACLAHNGWTGSGEVTIGVEDALGFASGTFVLRGHEGSVAVERTETEPEVAIDLDALGSLLFGAVDVSTLAAASRVRGDHEAIERFDACATGAPAGFSLTFF